MFCMTGATRYKYIPNYSDMRGGYDKLCGVVRSLGETLRTVPPMYLCPETRNW